VAGDSIYNGADDNASGVAALLEVARRFAALPPGQRPARSLLFIWHTGEENGLLGSAFFAEHPTVPRDSIVAYLNLDMIGRNAPDSLFVLGSRRLSAELGQALEAVNARQPRPFVLDYSLDAPRHPQHTYCRSDQASFARFGIPVVFLTSSLHPQYHTPADEAATLDYDKVARVTALVGDLAADLATRPARPAITGAIPRPGSACQQ
jgi:Zn-dependent M28 family amino/carboxypeptidase